MSAIVFAIAAVAFGLIRLDTPKDQYALRFAITLVIAALISTSMWLATRTLTVSVVYR